ncbi:alpha/beta hydrolase [Oscillospiraceae bacterium PP1C4]
MEQMKTNHILKIGGRIMLGLIIAILICMVILAGAVFMKSSNKATPFLDKSGNVIEDSISEKLFVEINGVKQGMFIKGKDKTKPVLLFLHGGPGVTEQWINQIYPSGIEDEFVVCWWEQRGAGVSYSKDIPVQTITSEQLVLDTIEVTNYLRERFGKEKIYLLGHSWGSTLGVYAAEMAPELYYAYIGMGQVAYHSQSQKTAYDYMLDYYTKSGDKKMVKKLLKVSHTMENPSSEDFEKISDEVIHKAGVGTTRDMKSIITGVFIPSFFASEYTVNEKINLWKGKWADYARTMKQKMDVTDLSTAVTTFKVPVYFLHGKYDYTCAYPMAKDYLDKIDAPLKGFYTFEESAHSPMFEEPEKFMKIMREDVLNAENHLADK